MTTGQIFLGLVTLLIATIVYRWQKSVDRELQIADEYRGYIIEYLKSTQEYYSLLHVKWGWGAHRELNSPTQLGELGDKISGLRAGIELLGKARVLKALDEYQGALAMVEHKMEMLDTDRVDEDLSEKYLASKESFTAARLTLIQTYRSELSDGLITRVRHFLFKDRFT